MKQINTYDRNTSIMMRLEVNYLVIATHIIVCLILNYLIIAPPTLKCSTSWIVQPMSKNLENPSECDVMDCPKQMTNRLFIPN